MNKLTSVSVTDNMLTSSDTSVRQFLNVQDSDWENYQTVPPPGGVQTASVTASYTVAGTQFDSVILSWSPILYTGDGGYYEVYYSTTSGGPYTQFGCQTMNKTISGCTVEGLVPETTYYFVIRTFTPSHNGVDDGSFQQNDLTSFFSVERAVQTAALPAGFTLLEPVDGTTITHGYGNPTYAWNEVGGATGYDLYVTAGSNEAVSSAIFLENLNPATYCVNSLCSIEPTAINETYRRMNGTYQVWIRVLPSGDWQGPFDFTLAADPPGVPTMGTVTNPDT